MSNNIFLHSKFGEIYQTRDGRKALVVLIWSNRVSLIVEGTVSPTLYHLDGRYAGYNRANPRNWDLVLDPDGNEIKR